MNILCITDQQEASSHSAVEGIFGGALRERHAVTLVYFSRTASEISAPSDHSFVVPHRLKHGGLLRGLSRHMDLRGVDTVIVRNYFPVLRAVLSHRSRHACKVGFWHSFPHSFRRVFEARFERKAVLRKTIECALNRFVERRLVGRCDFLIAMTSEFRAAFYPGLAIPFLALPMGVDCRNLPARRPPPSGPISFAYTGTVDSLRQTNMIVNAFREVSEAFALDFYTASDNEAVAAIARHSDPRIRVNAALPREALLERLSACDVGVGLIPDNELYRVSSPGKTAEYAAVGMAPLVNGLPDYRALFDEQSAFFCDFEYRAIRDKVRELATMDRARISAVGARARESVRRLRDYRVLAAGAAAFLDSIQAGGGSK